MTMLLYISLLEAHQAKNLFFLYGDAKEIQFKQQFDQLIADPTPVSFGQLYSEINSIRESPFRDREVVIRGFIYETDAQHAVLAPQPNLKSCCIGDNSRFLQQIYLTPKVVESSGRAVTVRGLLRVDESSNNEILGYRLEHVTIVGEEGRSLVPPFLLLAGLIAGFSAIKFNRMTMMRSWMRRCQK